MVSALLDLSSGEVRHEFTEVHGAKSAIRRREFDDPVEPPRAAQNSGVECGRVVCCGDHYNSLLCSEAVQAIQQVRQTHPGWREPGGMPRKGAVDVLQYNHRRCVARGDLEHALEVEIVRFFAKQSYRMAVELAPVEHGANYTRFPVPRRPMEEVPTAKRQTASFEPLLTLKESFKIFS